MWPSSEHGQSNGVLGHPGVCVGCTWAAALGEWWCCQNAPNSLLEQLEGPVAFVAVIGAYRTGKSFLLNQLLSLPCDDGLVVGHRRETQTKGVWLWSSPQSLSVPGHDRNVSVVYMDTEGFEGAGQAGVCAHLAARTLDLW